MKNRVSTQASAILDWYESGTLTADHAYRILDVLVMVAEKLPSRLDTERAMRSIERVRNLITSDMA